MSAPSLKKTETLEVRVPFETKERFKELADRQGESVSTILRGLVYDFLQAPRTPALETPAPRAGRKASAASLIAVLCLVVVSAAAVFNSSKTGTGAVSSGAGEPSGEPAEPVFAEP